MTGAEALKASDLSEMLLEQTGKALLNADFEAFALYFAVPHVIDTPDRKTTLKTRGALRALFERVVQEYRDLNVTSLIRYCEVAEYRTPLRVEATHWSHVMSGDQRVMEPYFGFSVIEFIDGRWQLTSSQYAADKETNVGRALHNMIDQGAPTLPLASAKPILKKETNQ